MTTGTYYCTPIEVLEYSTGRTYSVVEASHTFVVTKCRFYRIGTVWESAIVIDVCIHDS